MLECTDAQLRMGLEALLLEMSGLISNVSVAVYTVEFRVQSCMELLW